MRLFGNGYVAGLKTWANTPRDNGIFGCPSEPDTGSTDSMSGYGYRGSHYGRLEYPGDTFTHDTETDRRTNILRKTLWDLTKPQWGYYIPGKAGALAEANAGSMPHQWRNHRSHWLNIHTSTSYWNGGQDIWRHNGRIGIWFVDGRVERLGADPWGVDEWRDGLGP